MTLLEIEQRNFLDQIEGWWKFFSKEDPLLEMREKAWEIFQEVGLPDTSFEAFRSIKLRSLFSGIYSLPDEQISKNYALDAMIYPECEGSCLVFVNGIYAPHLSRLEKIPAKVEVLPLKEAFFVYGTLLNNHWNKTLREETDPFALLNFILHTEAAFIYLPPKVVVDSPIQILHLVDTEDSPLMVMPRLQIFAGHQSSATFVVQQKGKGESDFFINQVIDFSLEEAAQIELYEIEAGYPSTCWQMNACRTILKRDSRFKSVLFTDGAAGIRNDYRMTLAGENCEALLNGVNLLAEKRESHVHIFMDHQAPHCRSYQHFKSVLNDFSRSSFEGKIMVRQIAQKTEAFQLNNNLILSDNARADSKPNLEIFADDVKASHGATIGQLDVEQLHYMKTRGLSEKEAKNLLVYGFCQTIAQMMRLPSVLKETEELTRHFLKKEEH